MCSKITAMELASLQSLMAMVLNVIIADVFGARLKTIRPELRLSALEMTDSQRMRLEQLISEFFDGLVLSCRPEVTLGEIHALVVDDAFKPHSVAAN